MSDIYIKLTDEQLLAMKEDVNFAPFVESLQTIQALKSARGERNNVKEGAFPVSTKRVTMQALLGATAFGAEYPFGITTYIFYPSTKNAEIIPEILRANLGLPTEDEEGTPLTYTWADIAVRSNLLATESLAKAKLNVAEIMEFMADADLTLELHSATLAKVNSPEWKEAE